PYSSASGPPLAKRGPASGPPPFRVAAGAEHAATSKTHDSMPSFVLRFIAIPPPAGHSLTFQQCIGQRGRHGAIVAVREEPHAERRPVRHRLPGCSEAIRSRAGG